jgi:hypothetical protein
MQPIPKPNRHPVSKLSLIPALISLTTGLVHAEILDTSFQAVDSLRHEAIASWNFDQNQGDTLRDASGHKYNGVIHGAQWVNGVSGKGLSFAGQDWVEIPGDSNLALQSFTFSIWLHQSGNGLRCPLIEFQKPGETVGVHLWANAGGWSADYPGSFFGNIRPADASLSQSGSYRERNLIITDGGAAPGGRWNHVVLTYDHETSGSNLYVNGKLQKSVAFIAPLEPRTSGSIFLGMRSPTSLDWDAGMGLVGILDQADIFNRALSKTEVRTLYGRTVEEPKTIHLGIKTHYAKADAIHIEPGHQCGFIARYPGRYDLSA